MPLDGDYLKIDPNFNTTRRREVSPRIDTSTVTPTFPCTQIYAQASSSNTTSNSYTNTTSITPLVLRLFLLLVPWYTRVPQGIEERKEKAKEKTKKEAKE